MTKLGFNSRTDTVLRVVIGVFWAMGLVFTLTSDLPAGQRLFLLGLLAAFALLTLIALWYQTPERAIYLILGLQALIILAGALALNDFTVLIPAAVILTVVLLPPPWGLRATVPFLALLMGIDIYLSGLAQGFRDGIVTGFITFSFAVFANSLLRADEARRESQRLLKELQTTHRRLQVYAEQVEELAIAEERNRLSRDMHDTLGHRLTVSIVQLEGAERLIPIEPERAARKISAVLQQLEKGLAELRQTVAMLRTPITTDLSLPRALKQLARDFEQATQLHVQVSVPDGIPPLPDSYRLALYRVAQEVLTNVQRHAHAKNISLALRTSPQKVTLEVTDDGVGITGREEVNGFGIRGIRERASQLDGKVEVLPAPERGTRLVIQLPRSGEDYNGAN